MQKSILSLFNYFIRNHANILELAVVFFLTMLISYMIGAGYRKIFPKLQKSAHVWDDALVFALYKPLKYAIFWNALALGFTILGSYSKHLTLVSFIEPLRQTGTVFVIVWFLIRFIRELEKNRLKQAKSSEKPLDQTTLRAISQLLRLAVIMIAGLIVLPTLGIPLSGIVAFGGVGGVAIAFASKDLLANFFGGLMVFLDRPFAIGDWIRSPDKNIEGTVEHIGWRLTCIRTFDKRPLFIPNSFFSTIAIENPSRMQNRRIKTVVGVRYEDAPKIKKIVTEIEQMLREHKEIDQTKTLFVNLINFAPYSLEFLIYTFTKTTNWVRFQQVQQDVFLKVLEIIEKNEAQCAYPTTTLDLPNNPPVQLKEKMSSLEDSIS